MGPQGRTYADVQVGGSLRVSTWIGHLESVVIKPGNDCTLKGTLRLGGWPGKQPGSIGFGLPGAGDGEEGVTCGSAPAAGEGVGGQSALSQNPKHLSYTFVFIQR